MKMRLQILFAMMCTAALLCGCNKNESAQFTKWEYTDFGWPASQIKFYGYKNIHCKMRIRSKSEGPWENREVVTLSSTLSDIGSLGWEIVWVSPTGEDFILKRPSACEGTFIFDYDIDFKGYEKDEAEKEAKRKKEEAEFEGDYRKRLNDTTHTPDSFDPTASTVKSPSPEEIAAAKQAEADRVQHGQERTLKWLQDQADKGDSYAQRRLGERYVKGDGVETNVIKARELLTKASAQGDKEAADLLEKLNNK